MKQILPSAWVLKQMAKGGRFDNSLDLYDEQIIPIAKRIFEKRKSFLEVTSSFSNLLPKYFRQ